MTALKTLLIALLLLATSHTQAQYLSLKQLLLLAEKADHFHGDGQPFEVKKMLREKGFARVRWRQDDPDMDGNPGGYKLYSRVTDAFLIFYSDMHVRLLEGLEYRVRNTACVAQLRKQLLAAGFIEYKRGPVPGENPDFAVNRISPYDASFTNARYSISISGAVDENNKDLHRYSVSIERDAAMQQMYDEINAVSEEIAPEPKAKPLKKSR